MAEFAGGQEDNALTSDERKVHFESFAVQMVKNFVGQHSSSFRTLFGPKTAFFSWPTPIGGCEIHIGLLREEGGRRDP